MEKARKRRLGEPPKEWNPEYAARIAWYPKTREAFVAWQQRGRERMARLKAEGRMPTRRGVPDGWGGKQELLKAVRETARAEAREIVSHMAKKKMVSGEDPRAEEALEEMIAIVRARDPNKDDTPLYGAKERISAAGLLLAFLKQKPVQATDVRVGRAEDFLAAVVIDMKGEDAALLEHDEED